MNTLELIREYGHEEVAFFNNEKAGLKCIIGIHSTKLGPALGGCRLWPYKSEEAALFDVLRLSRGMSFKNAAAGLPIGGGKGVIIADPSQKSEDSKADTAPSGGSAEVVNASFEEGENGWSIENIDGITTQVDYQQKADDAHSGEFALHFWGENGTKFRAFQTVAAQAGTYSLKAFVQGGFSGGDTSQNVYIYCSVDGTEYTAAASLSGWSVWQEPVISGIQVPEGAQVIIGVYVEAGEQSWGTIDDFELTPE